MFKHTRVKDCMIQKVISFSPDQNIIQAIQIMLDNKISGAPVLQNELMIGIISSKDCLNAVIVDEYFDQNIGTVKDHMHTNIKTIYEDDRIIDLASEFTHCPYHRLPVINDDGSLVGIVTRNDVLKIMYKIFKEDHDSGRPNGNRF